MYLTPMFTGKNSEQKKALLHTAFNKWANYGMGYQFPTQDYGETRIIVLSVNNNAYVYQARINLLLANENQINHANIIEENFARDYVARGYAEKYNTNLADITSEAPTETDYYQASNSNTLWQKLQRWSPIIGISLVVFKLSLYIYKKFK